MLAAIYSVKMQTDDWDLLRQYAERRSEEAFATLVGRHVDLVYSVVPSRLSSRRLLLRGHGRRGRYG